MNARSSTDLSPPAPNTVRAEVPSRTQQQTALAVQPSRWGFLEQGTIFAGAVAEGYEAREVFGIVITARCDLAHSKAPVINYLPIVPLADWTSRDFLALAIDKCEQDVRSAIKSLLSTNGHSTSILTTEPASQILVSLFPPAGDSKAKNGHSKAEQLLLKLKLLDQVRTQSNVSNANINSLQRDFKKQLATLIRDVFHQRVTGYYFLDSVDGVSRGGYIALLRQVQILP